MDFPTSPQLESAVLNVLEKNPNISSAMMDSIVSDTLKLSEEVRQLIHSGNRTELAYRLAWARTRAKKKGLIVQDQSNRTWNLATK